MVSSFLSHMVEILFVLLHSTHLPIGDRSRDGCCHCQLQLAPNRVLHVDGASEPACVEGPSPNFSEAVHHCFE